MPGFRDLGATAAIAAVIAGVSVIATSGSLGASELSATFSAHWNRAFEGSPWSYAPLVTGLALGAAVVVTGIETVLSRRREYHPKKSKPITEARPAGVIGEVRARLQGSLTKEEPDVVSAWDDMLRGAIQMNASDIHVSPGVDRVQITYRVEGDLHEVASAPLGSLGPLVTRLKILSNLDTTVRGTPQDGRLATTVDGQALEARVSTLPTETGERLVLRILRGGRAVPDVQGLGLGTKTEAALVALLSRAQGLLFVTGPVGSGKTTTLYASLQHIARTRARTTSLVTLEDPIELDLPFATQTQINPKTGLTFAGSLRSVLRQDPNVLMVGEIRDSETAEIAMQAGLTGHLILTTVHGQSAAGAFARIIEMGVEPFLLVSATIGCLSQRLVRRLCPVCRRPAPIDPLVAERFEKAGAPIPKDVTFYEPAGCDKCNGDGFQGRVPIAELLELGDPIRKAVKDRLPTSDITRIAVAEGMTPLIQDGLRRAIAGDTSLAEIARVIG